MITEFTQEQREAIPKFITEYSNIVFKPTNEKVAKEAIV
mgnify:CR=1 FL=1